jgi:hypothetical protein
LAFIADALRAQLVQFRAVAWLGLAGIALGGLCLVVALVSGVEIPPEGDLADTATFDGALGIFMLTLAVLAPGVRWSARGQRIWTRLLVAFVTYSYAIETVQAFRGLDPRFSRVGSPLDQIAGLAFLLVALGVMGCFTVLAVKYFRARATPVVVAVRYGAAASWIAFFVGIWMSVVTRGRVVPEAGNLLVLHAAGFHGLQAIPLIALLHWWGRTPEAGTRRQVHFAGVVWLAMCLAIGWQSASGRAILDPSPAPIVAVLCLAGVVITGARAAGAFWRKSAVVTVGAR